MRCSFFDDITDQRIVTASTETVAFSPNATRTFLPCGAAARMNSGSFMSNGVSAVHATTTYSPGIRFDSKNVPSRFTSVNFAHRSFIPLSIHPCTSDGNTPTYGGNPESVLDG